MSNMREINNGVGEYIKNAFSNYDNQVSIKFSFDNASAKRVSGSDYLLVFGIRWGSVDRIGIGCDLHQYFANAYINIYGALKTGKVLAMEDIAAHVMQQFRNFAEEDESVNKHHVSFNNFVITNVQEVDNKYLITVSAILRFNSQL